MANGKFPTWEEWNEQMTEEMRRYSSYKIMEDMHAAILEQTICQEQKEKTCTERMVACAKVFASKSEVTWLTWGFRAAFIMLVLSILSAMVLKFIYPGGTG
jgi:hypothetical protein